MTLLQPCLLSVQDVFHGYQDAGLTRNILEGINLEISGGEQVALTGQSGSGKSTLLNLLGALDVPHKGRILFDGIDLSQMKEPERTLFRRKHIGFIYQFFNLIPTLTIVENVMLPLDLNGVPTAAARHQAITLLEEVGLSARADSYPDKLSGGEQQRVAIVRALSHQPQLVLADEPTGNLDAATGEQVLNLLDRLVRARGHTLVLVTHSPEVAQRADRTVRLTNGQLLPT